MPRLRIWRSPGPCAQPGPWPSGSDGRGSSAAGSPSCGRHQVVADQNAFPLVDQGLEGLFVPIGVDHEEGCGEIAHDPQPLQDTAGLIPGRLVQVVYLGLVYLLPNGLVMRFNCLRDPVDHFLDGT